MSRNSTRPLADLSTTEQGLPKKHSEPAFFAVEVILAQICSLAIFIASSFQFALFIKIAYQENSNQAESNYGQKDCQAFEKMFVHQRINYTRLVKLLEAPSERASHISKFYYRVIAQ